MHTAGYRVEWRDPKKPSLKINFGHLVVVELRGHCSAPLETLPPIQSPVSLASSPVVNGRVLPFSHVECPALSRLLGPSLINDTEMERDYLYGRAMGRLLAHEFYHVLGQTIQHTGSGISKDRFTAADLLGEHFDFEDGALTRLRQPVETAIPLEDPDEKSIVGK